MEQALLRDERADGKRAGCRARTADAARLLALERVSIYGERSQDWLNVQSQGNVNLAPCCTIRICSASRSIHRSATGPWSRPRSLLPLAYSCASKPFTAGRGRVPGHAGARAELERRATGVLLQTCAAFPVSVARATTC